MSVDTIEYPEETMVHSESAEVIEGDAETVLKELGKRIPGVDVLVVDHDDDEEEEEETDWENDRDPKHFMAYISSSYPSKIPKHDGTSTLGCERAILFLKNLDREISEAIRADAEDSLDLGELEKIRIKLNNDMTALSDHANNLKRKRKTKASSVQDGIVKGAGIEKVASTATLQVVVTPFERAIAGIITNAVVSAGKPFEKVFEFLKEKYDLSDREELAIFQLLKDMGHPIFKDRGTLGKSKDSKDPKSQGVEFIKNYFA
jgi:hypothetical protein